MNQYEWLFNETNFKGLAHLFLILYATRLAPELPKVVLDLFTNGYFKLFIYVLILYTANVNPTTALLIAIAFMVTLNLANQKKMFEMMEDDMPTETPAPEEDVAEINFDSMTEDPVAVTEAPVPVMSVSETQTPVPSKVFTSEPAMTPAAQEQKVPEEVEADLPCYPERKYDITKVHPIAGFDNYSEFLLTA